MWICDDCSTRYNHAADRCPHCGSTNRHKEGEDVAKSSRAGGPTNAGDRVEPSPSGWDALRSTDDTPVDPDTAPVRPSGNASTDAWLEYVIAIGGDPEDGLGRADLIVIADEIEADPDTGPGEEE